MSDAMSTKKMHPFFSPKAAGVKRPAASSSTSSTSSTSRAPSSSSKAVKPTTAAPSPPANGGGKRAKVAGSPASAAAGGESKQQSGASSSETLLSLDALHPSWVDALGKEEAKPYFRSLNTFVEQEYTYGVHGHVLEWCCRVMPRTACNAPALWYAALALLPCLAAGACLRALLMLALLRRLHATLHHPSSCLPMHYRTSRKGTVFPPKEKIFSAFTACPFDKVRVVVLGQDPYHGPGQAHGLAFSVEKGIAIPPSLRNMIKEAVQDVGITKPGHGNLQHWYVGAATRVGSHITCKKVRRRTWARSALYGLAAS